MIPRMSGMYVCALLMASAACTAARLPPFGDEVATEREKDEIRLWSRAVEEQERLDGSGFLYDDPDLSRYLNGIAAKLTPEELRGSGIDFDIKVLKSPYLNAFAYPNGVIYIHTGMIARMENEAQLAALMGHEMTHAIYRHSVQNLRTVKINMGVFATMGGLVPIIGHLGGIGSFAAIAGFSRELEAEADRVGLELMTRAGYDPGESIRFFEHIKKELEEQETEEPFFFGTHPHLKDRIESYRKLIEAHYQDVRGDKGEEIFIRKTFAMTLENVGLDLSMGRFPSAEAGAKKILGTDPDHAEAYFLLAEVFRMRNEEGDFEKARDHYRDSIRRDPAYADPHRNLGMLYYKQGSMDEAKAEFKTYLSLESDAADRDYIEQYLDEIDKPEGAS